MSLYEDSFCFGSEEEIKLYEEEINSSGFISKYAFLRAHKGLKNGNIHTFIGTSGGGKSTLSRTLILDALDNIKSKDEKIVIWLSEEKTEDYVLQLYKSGISFDILKNYLKIYSEIDNAGKNSKQILDRIKFVLNNNRAIAFFYDNITTSMEYASGTVSIQDNFFADLKKLCVSSCIPFVIFAHTNAKINENYEGIIDQNDIRGSKAPAMLSEFFYIMQSFYIKNERFNTIKITKNRGLNITNRLYLLNYMADMFIFNTDKQLDFEEFKEIWKERNRL